ncbi:MAG TPA: serine hydrolase domain-containing protein [Methylomirabilota bacterium]|nr:serine hydrolase domain-containing protein [Methylomirabilota bacterium]
MRGLVILLLVLVPVVPVTAAHADAIDDYIKAEMERRHIPGLALAVARHGKIMKMKGYGVANLEHDVPVTPDTVFELASVTKQFTAAAIMLLVEEGKVQLDDPLPWHLPRAPEKWKAITVRHLLTHTSGLPGLREGFKALRPGGTRMRYTTAQLFDAAIKDDLGFPAGERYEYSDVGYAVLGMIIEAASGQRYRDFLDARFFKPLGMTSTSVIDVSRIQKGRAGNYTLRDGKLVNYWRVWDVEMPSHYGVLSTVKDLVTWDRALAAGQVLKPASLTEMWTPVRLNSGATYPYGFGWVVDERRGHRWISHSGITGTELSRLPDDGLTVVVLTNLGADFAPGNRVNSWGLAYGVAGRYVKGLLVGPQKPEPDPDPARTARVREMLERMARNEPDPLMLPLTASYVTPLGRTILGERLATLKSFTFVTCDDTSARALERFGARIARVCHYRTVNAEETRYYSFWLTADGVIAAAVSSTE